MGVKYNLTFDALRLSRKHKLELPAWNHISDTPESKTHKNKKLTKCLQKAHQVRTIEDLTIQDEVQMDPYHNTNEVTCNCPTCTEH